MSSAIILVCDNEFIDLSYDKLFVFKAKDLNQKLNMYNKAIIGPEACVYFSYH